MYIDVLLWEKHKNTTLDIMVLKYEFRIKKIYILNNIDYLWINNKLRIHLNYLLNVKWLYE